MPVYLTSEGLLTTVARDQKPRGKIQERVITTRREWEAVASAWPLKQLVAIWNGWAGVKPVQRFTSGQIAVERIWRVIAGPEPVRRRSGAKPERSSTLFREGSKAAQAYALLVRPHGVTLEELERLTGWQRHSIRGFLSSSARKHGFYLPSFRRAGERVYQMQEQ